MTLMIPLVLVLLLAWPSGASEAGGRAASSAGSVGFLLPNRTNPRWAQDAQYFVRRMHTELPKANVVVVNAKGKESTQLSQAQVAISEGVKVLVVAPVSITAAAGIVTAAHKHHVTVIAYDQPIKVAHLDLYTGFDAVASGRLEAAFIEKHVKKAGHLVLMNGPTGDRVAKDEYRGYYTDELKSAIRDKRYTLAASYWTGTWSAADAREDMAAALSHSHDQVQGVVPGSDALSTGVLKALQAARVKSRVWVTGTGATLAGLRHVLQGKQGMTVYGPVYLEANAAADASAALLTGAPMPAAFDTKVQDGDGTVRAAVFKPTGVTTSNMAKTVVKDKFVSVKALCKGLEKLCKKYHIR